VFISSFSSNFFQLQFWIVRGPRKSWLPCNKLRHTEVFWAVDSYSADQEIRCVQLSHCDQFAALRGDPCTSVIWYEHFWFGTRQPPLLSFARDVTSRRYQYFAQPCRWSGSAAVPVINFMVSTISHVTVINLFVLLIWWTQIASEFRCHSQPDAG
jgi:hypothetical protein